MMETTVSTLSNHLDAVVKLLNLNKFEENGVTPDDEVFKILILDSFCRDVLSPLIQPNELRKHGITLFFTLDKERQKIPDVPAIYFVQATSSNVDRIIKDASMGIYESFYLNFSSPLARASLEKLAMGTLKGDCSERITKVHDQYLDFISLEQGMFSLGLPQAYVQLNDPKAQDKDVEDVVDSIVNGLFCVIVTLGVVPWIRCPKDGPAEMVATRLDARLRHHLASGSDRFTQPGQLGSSFQRPLLCIFDRTFELTAAVQHVWSYRAMVHDVLGMKLSKVTHAGKSYELDESDSFWKENGSVPFPRVAEEVQEQLSKYKQEVDAVNKRAGSRSDQQQEAVGSTKHLMSAVSSLPELTERKKMIDKHTNLAFALLDNIKARSLDSHYNLEDDMLTRGTVDRSALLSVLKGKGGSKDDKLRTAIVYLLSVNATSMADIEAVEAALKEADADLSSFLYVKKVKSQNVSMVVPSAPVGTRSNLADWAGRLYGQSRTAVTTVKNFWSGGRQVALSKAVEGLMEARAGPDTDAFLLFDPRSSSQLAAGSVSRGPAPPGPFKEAIVFMIGGGNYHEYSSLQELSRRQSPGKTIIYGSTETLTGKEFVDQLASLGRKMGVEKDL